VEVSLAWLTGCSSRTRSSRLPLRGACCVPDSADVRRHRVNHMHLISISLAVGLLTSSAALASTERVELTYRLQPSQDVITENTIEGVTTIRVTEDRGVVAKSGGRLSQLPTTIVMKRKQSLRYVNRDPEPDGSFSAEMRFLEQRTSIQGPDGQEKVLPERTALSGLSVVAVIERDGSIRPGSTRVFGLEAPMAEQLIPTVQGVLAQAASIPSITLSFQEPVSQQIQMQVPVPGLASLEIKMMVTSKLLSIDDGIARIQQIHSMDFGLAPSGMKMSADGSGGGSMLYDTRSRTVLSNDSFTLMRMTFEMPEGIVEVRMNLNQLQQTRPATSVAK
jgi:hypothetical protein